ncbi:MAG: methyltransferase [Candidatus Brocadia sp.]|nr:methyltransferase domain-containing protein [Candidatus Brocadia sp.]MCE7912857.1 methyltransferase domain-containing protein [Candidatus Brocadia sp. AMX3]RIJ92330.1 MAG: methyltransferase [Candidatus Brocadia sp.]
MSDLETKKQGGLGYLLDLASSYYKSKVLFVSTDLGIFSVLLRARKDVQTIAREIKLERRPVEMLLNACVSLGLLEKKEGLYSNSSTAEMFLVKGKPMYVGEAFQVLDRRSYKLWDRLKEAVKTNTPQAYLEGKGDLFEEMTKNKEEMHAFFRGLHALAYWPASSLARIFDFTPYRHLLDVGGGSGAYSIALVKRHAHLNATILDLPPVCKIAQENIAKENLSHRISTLPGDFFKDDFPKGVDIILFSNLLHDWEEKKIEHLLKKTFEVLPSKGGVIISDMVLSNDGTEPLYAALMSLTLLLDTHGGSNYTEEQYTRWLDGAGFREISVKPLSGPNGIVTGTKP